MKKIGITCDNWKLETFKKELEAKGFNNYEVYTLPHKCNLIRIDVPDEGFQTDSEEIRRMCVRIEHNLKRSN